MLTITNPTESELETMLRFAFQHLPPNELALRVEAMTQQYQSGKIDLRSLFQATHEGTLVGALYAQSRPDGSVMLWVPTLASGFPLEPLLESLLQFCRSNHAFAAVALADRTQSFDEQTFCTAGQFRFLSDLIHLAVEIPPEMPVEKSCRLQFVPLSTDSDDVFDRLERLVKETYRHSLDFPDLMQIAPVEAVLQGYKAGALFRPELWFFLQSGGKDVGALLLTDASPDQMELTYMGLIESARGHGFSREIVGFAKAITSRAKRALLLTSVDEKNIPACQSYLSHGFQAWDRKKVYARIFSECPHPGIFQ
jgi:GNAT superfamily N-acetyltransferase